LAPLLLRLQILISDYLARPMTQIVRFVDGGLVGGIFLVAAGADGKEIVFLSFFNTPEQYEALRDRCRYTPLVEGEYERWLGGPLFDPSLWRITWNGDLARALLLLSLQAVKERGSAEYQKPLE
jgi:hypothetical protein